MTFDFTVNLSDILYEWIVDQVGNDNGASYNELLSNATNCGHGLENCFFYLIAVSVIAPLLFYFGLASNVKAATKMNYIMTWIIGYVCLLVINFVGLQIAVPDADVFAADNLANIIKISLIDVVYYTLLFEVVSLCVKDMSKASNIDLWSVFFGK